MILLIKSAIYSIFKICKLQLPEDDEIRILLQKHFPLVLIDEFFELPYEDFNDWVSKNDEVHAFLMEFFDIQTRYNAMKAYIKYLSEFEMIFDANVNKEREFASPNKEFTRKGNIFDKSSFMLFSKEEGGHSESNSVCSVEKIFAEIGTMLLKIDPKVKPIFLELIDPDKTGSARKDRYMRAIKAVCLFMAVDKDMSHSLSKSEMGTLIWLLSGEEPNDTNLNGTIEKLDANGDSAIELSEWLDFLATKDNRGRKVLNYTLKQKFDLYDEDANGSISMEELEKMIIDSFSDLLSKTVGDNKKVAESVVRDLAKIIMQKMDFNSSNNLDVKIY